MLIQKFNQSSLLDFLVDQFKNKTKDRVDIKIADALFSIWKDKRNKISDTVFRKPITISSTELERAQDEGLIKLIGDKIEITAKGAKVLKTMILGDERSIFEDNGKNVDYKTAENITKTRQKKYSKQKEDAWWGRYSK
jgi:predicted methyltransferase